MTASGLGREQHGVCDGKVVGDEVKGEMGQNCVMLEMKKAARKRGAGSPPFT